MLAVRLMQEQGIDVEALNFKTIFTCCQDQSAQAARALGVPLTVISQEDDYLDVVRNPRFGYGRGANPCVDCRIYMFQRARVYLEQTGADFVISGELVGQRPMSQKRSHLEVIAYHAGLEDRLLRPLSARRLPETLPERAGWVDRERLYGFVGRGRKGLIQLARQFGFEHIPAPSTGCSLTEPPFARKVFDLIEMPEPPRRWDFELLKVGRHFRFDAQTKVIVGRHAADNERLLYEHRQPESSSTALLDPANFTGPRALLTGLCTAAALQFAASLVIRYAPRCDSANAILRVDDKHGVREQRFDYQEPVDDIETIATK